MKHFLIIFSSFILILSSCEKWAYISYDELELQNDSNDIALFFEGTINSQNIFQKLFISKVRNFSDSSGFTAVTDAQVYLVSSDFDTVRFIPIDTVYAPYYMSERKFGVEINKYYTLHIIYEGEHYQATDTVKSASPFNFENIPLPEIDESFITEEGVYSFIIGKHYFGYPETNMWVWSNADLLLDSLNYSESALGESSYTHQSADVQGVFSDVTFYYGICCGDFTENDTLLAVKYSLSRNYTRYLRAFFMETDWKQGYFSAQSGNLPSNFNKGVAGYFSVSDCRPQKIAVSDLLQLIR